MMPSSLNLTHDHYRPFHEMNFGFGELVGIRFAENGPPVNRPDGSVAALIDAVAAYLTCYGKKISVVQWELSK
jgi:hypothetical protein